MLDFSNIVQVLSRVWKPEISRAIVCVIRLYSWRIATRAKEGWIITGVRFGPPLYTIIPWWKPTHCCVVHRKIVICSVGKCALTKSSIPLFSTIPQSSTGITAEVSSHTAELNLEVRSLRFCLRVKSTLLQCLSTSRSRCWPISELTLLQNSSLDSHGHDWPCAVCGRLFTQREEVLEHTKSEHAEQMFQVRTFIYWSRLNPTVIGMFHCENRFTEDNTFWSQWICLWSLWFLLSSHQEMLLDEGLRAKLAAFQQQQRLIALLQSGGPAAMNMLQQPAAAAVMLQLLQGISAPVVKNGEGSFSKIALRASITEVALMPSFPVPSRKVNRMEKDGSPYESRRGCQFIFILFLYFLWVSFNRKSSWTFCSLVETYLNSLNPSLKSLQPFQAVLVIPSGLSSYASTNSMPNAPFASECREPGNGHIWMIDNVDFIVSLQKSRSFRVSDESVQTSEQQPLWIGQPIICQVEGTKKHQQLHWKWAISEAERGSRRIISASWAASESVCFTTDSKALQFLGDDINAINAFNFSHKSSSTSSTSSSISCSSLPAAPVPTMAPIIAPSLPVRSRILNTESH